MKRERIIIMTISGALALFSWLLAGVLFVAAQEPVGADRPTPAVITQTIVITRTQIVTITPTPTPRILTMPSAAPLPFLDDVDAAFSAVWAEIQATQDARADQGLRYLQMPEVIVDVSGIVFSVECHEYRGPTGDGYVAIVRAAGWLRAAAHGPELRAYDWRLQEVEE